MADPEYDIPEFSYRTRKQTPAFDPSMRRIALGAGGIASLVIVVALVWSGMKPGLGFGGPPVIAAPPGPLRVVPANPGGLTVPEADEQIMSGASSNAPAQWASAGPSPDVSAFQPRQPVQVTPAPIAAPATPVTAPVAPAAIDKNILVQLAAAIDPEGAKKSWRELDQKMPDLFSGRTPLYSHAKVAGVEFWRLRVGGFTDIDAARQFCAKLKASGAACTVAAF